MEPEHTLVDPTEEEMVNLTTEMTALLEKYDCEIAVRSNIEILKRVPKTPNDTTTETKEINTEVHETIDSD